MDASILRQDKLHLVGIKVVGRRSELSHRVPMAWLDLVRRLDDVSGKVDPDIFYGVSPERHMLTDGENGVHAYWVTSAVGSEGEVPDDMQTLTIPGGEYAVATVRGGAERINATYLSLASWIEREGRSTDPDGYSIERYDQRRQRVTPPYDQFDYDILKPLR